MLCAAFAGCSGNGNGNETTTVPQTSKTNETTAAGTAAETTTEATTETIPNLDGYEFTICGSGEEWRDEATSALIQEMMDQYAEVEELLNCTISKVDGDNKMLITYGISGDKIADIVYARQEEYIPPALQGYIRPLDTDEVRATGLDVTDPEMVDTVFTGATKVNGHIWGLSWSGKYFAQYWGHAIAFNKRIVEEAGYKSDDIYQAVRDFKWDWDMFVEIAKAVSNDSDGNGVNDVDGYCLMPNELVEVYSNGVGFVYEGDDGKWKAGAATPQLITAAEFYYKCYTDADISLQPTEGMGNGNRRTWFYEGNAGFCCLYGKNFSLSDAGAVNMIMNDDFGYVPVPHGPDAKVYAHYIPDLWAYVIQTANQDWEKSCMVVAAIGERLTDPNSAEELYRKHFRDDESVEMLMDYMLPNALVQSARFSTGLRSLVDAFEKDLRSGVAAATACESFAKVMQTGIDELFGY